MTTGNDDMLGSNASNAYSFDSFERKKKVPAVWNFV